MKIKLIFGITILVILFMEYAYFNKLFWQFYISPIIYTYIIFNIIKYKRTEIIKNNIPKIYEPDQDYSNDNYQNSEYSVNNIMQYADRIERTMTETIYIRK